MDVDATQALPLSDYDDETDEEDLDAEKKEANFTIKLSSSYNANIFAT